MRQVELSYVNLRWKKYFFNKSAFPTDRIKSKDKKKCRNEQEDEIVQRCLRFAPWVSVNRGRYCSFLPFHCYCSHCFALRASISRLRYRRCDPKRKYRCTETKLESRESYWVLTSSEVVTDDVFSSQAWLVFFHKLDKARPRFKPNPSRFRYSTLSVISFGGKN